MSFYCNKNFLENQNESFYIFNEKKLLEKVSLFKKNFLGTILYAIKANPSKTIISLLAKNNIKSFDAASLSEIKLVRENVPDSNIFYMNPIKSRISIKESFFKYNVRDYAVDSFSEIKKIEEETNFSNELNFHIRLDVSNKFSLINLSNKFGVSKEQAPDLLKYLSKKNYKIGICFHVGSQCINANAYKFAINKSKNVIKKSGVKISYLNIGGGFPSLYSGTKPFCLKEYFNKIHNEFLNLKKDLKYNIKLFSEPGRSIVSDCMSIIVRVDLKKNNKLFINDGIYGSLNNAGFRSFKYPVRLFNRIDNKSELEAFSFFGPTCDSEDFMKGPFYLPKSVQEGDWIEVKQMGAYSITMRTNFNGFFNVPKVFLLNHKLVYDKKFY